MTVIAWDGKTLAADKRRISGTVISTGTKIRRFNDIIYGCAGHSATAEDMRIWIEEHNRDPEKFPARQLDSNTWAKTLLIEDSVVYLYECSPNPLIVEDEFTAIGSGREFAIAAMHCGKSAKKAVKIASIYDYYCGNGVDTLEEE